MCTAHRNRNQVVGGNSKHKQDHSHHIEQGPPFFSLRVRVYNVLSFSVRWSDSISKDRDRGHADEQANARQTDKPIAEHLTDQKNEHGVQRNCEQGNCANNPASYKEPQQPTQSEPYGIAR